MQPNEEKLNELVERIVEAVHPTRIILFGSAARGEMGPDSDLDVLVVMPGQTHRGMTAENLHRKLYGFGFAKDILVITDEDVARYAESNQHIVKTAMDEGKELYCVAA